MVTSGLKWPLDARRSNKPRNRLCSPSVLLANSRLSRRLLSLNPHATQLVVLVIRWCRVRCRTFLEYSPMPRNYERGLRQWALTSGREQVVATKVVSVNSAAGAGDSVSGFHAANPGIAVRMGGRDIADHLGVGAGRTGMAFIHQDLALVDSMTIVENLRINRFRTGLAGRIRWKDERATVLSALRKVGLDVSPDTRVGDLPITERALVAIARGLSEIADSVTVHEDRVLVLDEPTAYLPQAGVERLFDVIRGLAAEGTSILFVSHRVDEVLANCDRVLVLRNGRLVADETVTGHTGHSLAELMLGQPPEGMYPDRAPTDSAPGIEVSELAGRYADGVSFAAGRGEIVGFVGLPGGGYDEIPYLLTGATPARGGRIEISGRSREATGLTPNNALQHGIAMLPADRKGSGGALSLTAGENMTLPTLGKFVRWRTVLRSRAERQAVLAQMQRFDVRPRRSDLSLELMSGGNQQKVLLAKWIMAGPQVLALHEPTQGVDIGAKREVFAHLATLAAQGTVVLISSVEYEDLAHMCERVHVVAGGRIVRTLSGATLTAREVTASVYA